jgi:hypothetical protein
MPYPGIYTKGKAGAYLYKVVPCDCFTPVHRRRGLALRFGARTLVGVSQRRGTS